MDNAVKGPSGLIGDVAVSNSLFPAAGCLTVEESPTSVHEGIPQASGQADGRRSTRERRKATMIGARHGADNPAEKRYRYC